MVAAVQGIVLSVAACTLFPYWLVEVTLVIALALLAESFGRDIWWLYRGQARVSRRSAGKTLAPVGRG